MNSRPFVADCAKVYDESCFTSGNSPTTTNSVYLPSSLRNTAPAQFGPNHLLVTYGQQRRVLDTAATCVTGQSQQRLQPSTSFQQFGLFEQRPQFQQNVIAPVRQQCPSGVTYSFPNPEQPTTNNFRELGIDLNGPPRNFNPAISQQSLHAQLPTQLNHMGQPQMQCPMQNRLQQPMQVPDQFSMMQPQFQPLQPQLQHIPSQMHQFQGQIAPPQLVLTLEQQIALNELQKHALETMLLHETLRKQSFKLRFHSDGQTDTNDLPYKVYSDKIDLVPTRGSEIEKINTKKPESLHSEAAKRKILTISNQRQSPPKKSHDKEAQNVPDLTSVEVQCDTKNEDGYNCTCRLPKCEKDIQTDRKVVFDDEPQKILKKPAKDKHSKPISRPVNDDSDSSSTYDDSCDC